MHWRVSRLTKGRSQGVSVATLLEQAYRQTDYRIPALGITLRVDEPAPALDRWLHREGWRSWAFISAANPRSKRSDDATNRRQHRHLQQSIDALGLPRYEAIGQGWDGQWPPERSLFVPGLTQQQASQLCQQYRQNAVLYGEVGSMPRLLWCKHLGTPMGDTT